MNHAHESARVLVIGAGPAGATAAALLARSLGAGSTLLVERSAWPRAKTCGCCLGSAGVDLLNSLDLLTSAQLITLGAQPLNDVEILCGNASARLRHEGGMAIARDQLDTALVARAVSDGVSFMPQTSAKALRREHDRWIVRLSNHHHAPIEQAFDLVIVADGIGGSSLDLIPDMQPSIARGSWMGISTILNLDELNVPSLDAGSVRMHVGNGGYVGIVWLGGRRAAIAAALEPAAVRADGGPEACITRIAESCGTRLFRHANPTTDVPFVGTGLLTRRRRVALPGLLVVGDSAGYVEPFTGEGMTWAIVSGACAAGLSIDVLRTDSPRAAAFDGLVAAWTREHARLVGRRHCTCRAIRWLVHRPMLVGRTLALMENSITVSRVAQVISRRTRDRYGLIGGHA